MDPLRQISRFWVSKPQYHDAFALSFNLINRAKWLQKARQNLDKGFKPEATAYLKWARDYHRRAMALAERIRQQQPRISRRTWLPAYTMDEPLDPRRGEEPICENE